MATNSENAGLSGNGQSASYGSWAAEHAHALLDSTGEGIIALDSDNRCTFANAAARRMLGYETEQMLGADIHDLIYHAGPRQLHGAEHECPVCRAIQTGRTVRAKAGTFRTRENRSLAVEYGVWPINEGESFTGVVVTFRDVRERKREEERSGGPGEWTTRLLENITDAFYTLDLQWRFVYLNSEAERFLQRPREELLGKRLWEEFPEAVGSAFYTEFHRAVAEQVTVQVEDYYSPLEAWFEARAYPSEDGLSVYFLNINGRKRTEGERERLLGEAERYAAELDAVIHSIPDAVYIGDGSGIRACNDAALAMLGFEDLAEMNQNISILSERLQNRFAQTGERIPAEEEPFARALQGDTVVEEVLSRHLKTGQDRFVRCAAAPILSDDGILGAVAVNTDITERKRVEDELRDSELFLRSTLNSLSAHVAILDEEGSILATNRAWQGFAASNPPITGGTVSGSNYLEVCDAATGEGSEGARVFAKGIRDVIAGRTESFELEYPCHSPAERRWFLGKVTRFSGTYPSKVVVAHENVTERKLAVEEIKLRANQQESVADLGRRALSEPDLTILMDEAAEIVCQILEVEYCSILELLPEVEDLLMQAGRGWREGLVGTAAVSAGADSEAGYTLASDEPVILENLGEEERFSGSPLLHEHGIVSGMSAVIHGREGSFGVLGVYTGTRRVFTVDDVNFLRAIANVLGEAIESKKAEEEMNGIREAERSRMARDLHDGPLQDLTYALATTQLFQRWSKDSGLDYRLDNAVEAMKRTGQELRATVYDLRLEEHRGKPLPELVESLVRLNRRMAPDRSISLNIGEGFPSNPLGDQDPELLRILQEALTNVRRHSGARDVVVSLGVDGKELWAEVEDDGCGFGPKTVPGVGLSSMHERAHSLGGSLAVESELGTGTRVRFSVTRTSLHEHADEDEDDERGEKATPGQQIRVLLVDDHVSFRDAATAVFEQEDGFTVVGQVGTLAEAREIVDGGSLAADVALVDLDLPDGYGGDLIARMRESSPQTQVLVLSATLDQANLARAVEAGAAGTLHKSAGMDEVLDSIRRLLAGEALLSPAAIIQFLRLSASHRTRDQEAREAIDTLTPREREVLQALAEGLDGKEIALRLRISYKTERNHVASIMTKLGVHSRLQALVFALRHGVADIH